MKEAGTRQHRIRKREKVLFELLNSSLAQLGPERSDAHQDSFEANGVLRTNTGQIRQATALYYTIPALGKYYTTPHWRSVSIRQYEKYEKLAAFAVRGKPFARLYRFFERHAFREDAHLRAMEAIDSSNDLVENGNQLIDFLFDL